MTENSENPDDSFLDDIRPTVWEPREGVTPELFVEWAAPRFGRTYPERLNNPVWESLIRTPVCAWTARETFPETEVKPPAWCFQRFGQTSTTLPDGRIVQIAGEHEDWYDPDFHIFNDVVVRHPDGRIDIFGYPRGEFPPTDFHRATLVGNRIVIVGKLSYEPDRCIGTTQVAVLHLDTFRVELRPAGGSCPGWIHRHYATLTPDGRGILITGGMIDPGKDGPLIENIDDWRLDLDRWEWERLTNRTWQQWVISRETGRFLHISQAESIFWSLSRDTKWKERGLSREAAVEKLYQGSARIDEVGEEPLHDLSRFRKNTGPEADFRVVKILYSPPAAHEVVNEPDDDRFEMRLHVDGVLIRYTNEYSQIRIVVEGDLPQTTIDTVVGDLRAKLERLEGVPCRAVRTGADQGSIGRHRLSMRYSPKGESGPRCCAAAQDPPPAPERGLR